MSQVNTAIGQAGSTAGLGATTSTNRFSDLSTEEFVKVLFTELQNQDPFQPQDSGALLEQLSSLRNIESQITLQSELKNLVLQNQASSAGNMIGKTVEGLSSDNRSLTGTVKSVRMSRDGVILELEGGEQLDMSRVSRIHATAATGGVVDLDAQMATANQMIGSVIFGTDSENEDQSVFGQVIGVRMEKDRVLMQLDNGRSVDFKGVQDVSFALNVDRLKGKSVEFIPDPEKPETTAIGVVKSYQVTGETGANDVRLTLEVDDEELEISALQLTGVIRE